MDIYEYAEKFNADYYDPCTGYTYLVQEYNQIKRFGLPNLYGGIRIMDSSGNIIGIARKLVEEE